MIHLSAGWSEMVQVPTDDLGFVPKPQNFEGHTNCLSRRLSRPCQPRIDFHLSARFNWCRVRDLNSRPTVYKTAALPLS